MADPQRCQALRKDGTPCPGKILVDGTFCFAHAPGHAEARREANRRGGHNKASSARLAHLVPPRLVSVYDMLETALDEVHRGEIDPKVAAAMAALARAMVQVLISGETEERMRTLEARMAGSGKAPA